MNYIYRKTGNKYQVYNGNLERWLKGGLTASYVVKMSDQKIPIFSTSSQFQDNTLYWQLRVNTDNISEPGTTGPLDEGLHILYGTNSTARTALQNCVGSLWGLTGGGSTYSVDTPAVDYSNGFGYQTLPGVSLADNTTAFIYYYFAWDLNPLTPTYMYVNLGYRYNPTFSQFTPVGQLGFVENGVAVKTISLNSTSNRFKFVWNKTTNNVAIYKSANFFVSDFDTTPFGTYSFSATAMSLSPFYLQGIDLGASASQYKTLINTLLLDTVITNDHIGLAYKENYSLTSSPPISALLFATNSRY